MAMDLLPKMNSKKCLNDLVNKVVDQADHKVVQVVAATPLHQGCILEPTVVARVAMGDNNQTVCDQSYSSKLSVGSLQMLAGFPSDSKIYNIPRTTVTYTLNPLPGPTNYQT